MIDVDLARQPSHRLWLLAAIAAIALHVGGVVLALVHLPAVADDDALGAPAIEVGVEMLSPQLQANELPPGPDADASAASAARDAHKAEDKDSDLPKDTPQQAEQPDRVVAARPPDKVEAEQQQKAVQQQASTASAAAEASATPSNEAAKRAARSVAPAQGIGQAAARVRASWQKELVAYLDKHKRYPRDAAHKNVRIVVGFELDRRGHVLSTRIVESSGDPAFDAAALDMIKRSDPVPPPPPLIADEGLTFSLPVVFQVKGKGAG